MRKAVFQLEPFTCPSCIKKVESALLNTKGVETAKVLFNAGKVKVEFDGTAITPEALGNIIEKLGYKVHSQKAS